MMKPKENQAKKPIRKTGHPTLHYDISLLFPVLFLVGIGIVMVYSASSAIAMEAAKPDYFFLRKQALFGMAGIVVLVIFRHIPYRVYRSLAYPMLGISVAFLIAIQISGIGFSAGGANRWIRFGGLSFQPSEFARFALVIYLAYSLSKKKERLKEFSIGFLPHIAILGLLSGLIFMQPDFGSVVLLFALTWLLLFVAGVPVSHLIGGCLAALPAVYFLMMNAEYRMKRIMTFLDPWQYPSGEGYQIVHSLMAFGSGGIWGSGIGKGYQKLFYLPEPHTDFIFSVIGEELGLMGILVILMLYGLILWRGVAVAKNAGDTFGSLLAIGMTISLGFQVCVNMAVTLGLLPTKGLTLPFLSYGGTSLLMSMASIGVLMNIGAYKKSA